MGELPRAYQLLGVKPGDTEATLNRRFRRALFKVHPDRPGGDAKAAAMLNEVYDHFKRNLVGGRVPGPMEMFARIHGRPPPGQQRPPVVHVIHFSQGPGSWSTTTSGSSTTMSSSGTTPSYMNTGVYYTTTRGGG